jgi:flagellar motor switch/type III secretory pathway protein FliN
MDAERTISLVQRKARTGRDAQAARAMSLARALRLTAAKQADRLMGLALAVLGVTRKTITAQDIAECFNGSSLVLLMDGPGTRGAAVVLDSVVVTGLIQQQTMGRVTSVPEGEAARRHTATDAALCSPFVEAVLSGAAILPEEAADRDLLHGYRFGVWANEPRQAQLALDAPSYQLIELTLDLAAGARAGKMLLIVPDPVRPAFEPETEGEDAPVQGRPKLLAENVLGLRAELTIALTRLKLPLQKVTALRVGDVLDLDLSSMAQALVLDTNGHAISRGTLGQIDGMRALQVEQQKTYAQPEPRRRAADRDGLDLPDVTAAPVQQDRRAAPAAPAPDIPRLSDVDIFGNLDDLPNLPEMEEQDEWEQAPDKDAREDHLKQAGW